MSLSGDVGALTVLDVLQLIHLGGRTGTLGISRGGERGEVGFHRGRIVTAQGPYTHRLGDLLLEGGFIDAEQLAVAVERQRVVLPRRPLGRVLVGMGALSSETLRFQIERQLEQTARDLTSWRRFRFHFELGELALPDGISFDPRKLMRR